MNKKTANFYRDQERELGIYNEGVIEDIDNTSSVLLKKGRKYKISDAYILATISGIELKIIDVEKADLKKSDVQVSKLTYIYFGERKLEIYEPWRMFFRWFYSELFLKSVLYSTQMVFFFC